MRALFVLAALLIALSPASALAHEGVPHGQGVTAASASFDQSLLPVCPPGPAHLCGCGNLSLCDGSGKPAAVSGCSVCVLSPDLGSAMLLLSEVQAQPSPRFTPSAPRAPPLFA
jgi:hypothetical protein